MNLSPYPFSLKPSSFHYIAMNHNKIHNHTKGNYIKKTWFWPRLTLGQLFTFWSNSWLKLTHLFLNLTIIPLLFLHSSIFSLNFNSKFPSCERKSSFQVTTFEPSWCLHVISWSLPSISWHLCITKIFHSNEQASLNKIHVIRCSNKCQGKLTLIHSIVASHK